MTREKYKEMVEKIPKDKILGKEEIKGEEYIKTTFSTMIDVFPEKWIILTNPNYVNDDRIILCTILSVCSDDEITKAEIDYMNKGYNIGALRTNVDMWRCNE